MACCLIWYGIIGVEAYYKEAIPLREELIQDAEPMILQRAKSSTKKPKWQKRWINDKKEYEYIVDGVKESSLFFFIWTQWEREIRQAMMSCFKVPEACHQVHDAVYNTEVVDMKVMEAEVLEKTGFKVQISN